MKKLGKVIMFLLTVAIILTASFSVNHRFNGSEGKAMEASSRLGQSRKDKLSINQLSIDQLKAQIQFFQRALDSLGAASPEQAAKLWAEGPKTRNGVLQYAVACEGLKAKIVQKLGKPEESYWNIGISSPWVEKYEIGRLIKVNSEEYQTRIKYNWATSSGPAGTSEEVLFIVKKGDTWCIRDVQ